MHLDPRFAAFVVPNPNRLRKRPEPRSVLPLLVPQKVEHNSKQQLRQAGVPAQQARSQDVKPPVAISETDPVEAGVRMSLQALSQVHPEREAAADADVNVAERMHSEPKISGMPAKQHWRQDQPVRLSFLIALRCKSWPTKSGFLQQRSSKA